MSTNKFKENSRCK